MSGKGSAPDIVQPRSQRKEWNRPGAGKKKGKKAHKPLERHKQILMTVARLWLVAAPIALSSVL